MSNRPLGGYPSFFPAADSFLGGVFSSSNDLALLHTVRKSRLSFPFLLMDPPQCDLRRMGKQCRV